MNYIETEFQLEDELSRPSQADVEAMRSITGDIMVLGAGGKMGPSLARLVRRASERSGKPRRVIAVSRFSVSAVRDELERAGIETVECDLFKMESVARLPWCENVLYLAGRKFGSVDRPDFTWAVNTMVPAFVAARLAAARIVVFSTGNVYAPVPVSSGGSAETDLPAPIGEYAQSCLGRERVFEYFSRTNGTRCLLFRLNYATDLRYGVLVDIARRVYEGKPVSLTVGHFNTIWQGDANSFALRCLPLCQSPPAVLNVTGTEMLSVRETALFFSERFRREALFSDAEGKTAFLSNAARCHSLLGAPRVTALQLLDWTARWIEAGGTNLHKPTHFEVSDGKY